jgi:hypothetical protein
MKRLDAKDAWKLAYTLLAIILLVLSLAGCSKEETPNAPVTSVHSTKLVDNPAPAEMNFANFKSKTFSIDTSLLAFSGDRLFLKLNRQQGEVLFLGEINRYRPFSMTVEIRLDDTQLHYELFTNDINDDTQVGVTFL